MFAGTGSPIPPQDVAKVSARWSTGPIAPRLANFQDQAQQKWTVKAVNGTPGVPGSPTYKITIAGTDRALAMTDDGELTTVPAFSGAPEQLWTIEQTTDGSYRIAPKHPRGDGPPVALSALGASFATLSKLDPTSLKQRWALRSL
jgi:arabinan endo-1,5-alpha-L-arabinosidase